MIKRTKEGKFTKGNKAGNIFLKGNVPWNKGMKGIHLSPETQFKEGERIGPDHPSWKGGVQVIKNDVVHIWTGPNQRARLPRKIYEDHYGPIPKGHVIYHLDGDKNNDNPKNLVAISRAELLKRNLENR